MGVRWIRLDTTWSQSEWLVELPPASRLAWVELLCFVKSYGVAGSVKKPTPAYLARIWGLSKSSIEVMFAAAFHDGALVQDGQDLIVTGWSVRQSDPKAAERMKAYRERLKGENADPEPENVTGVTRNVTALRPVTPVTPSRARATLTETETKTERTSSPKSPPSRPAAREDDDDLERELREHQPRAKLNVIRIHGDTEEPVQIGSHRVGVGREIDVYKQLCREGQVPPEVIAAAIAYIPVVSNLDPPVSLARWGADDGRPIYEQCLNRAYRELST